MKRIFTVDEANRLLPFLQSSIAKLLALQHALDELVGGQRITHIDQVDPTSRSLFLETVQKWQQQLDNLRDAGALVKSTHTGLVDLYGFVKGREVLLCWRLGEERISWWHDVEAGFAGRQPLGDAGDSGPCLPN